MKESNEFLAVLQSMREDDLTSKVLVPLFMKLGYVDANFHGGSYEGGKDLIAYKHEAFGKISVLAAQVKRFKPTRSTKTSQQWHTIVRQLELARNKAIPCKDGQARKPSTVAFITPYTIDTRLLAEQFEAVQLHNIQIIDGAALYSEILRTWPSLLSDIGNVGHKIASTNSRALRNVELFESLKVADDVPFENIYSDLNFFVGRTETRELICSMIAAVDVPASVSYETWLAIKDNLLEVEKLVQFDLIKNQVAKIEHDYSIALRTHESQENIDRRDKIAQLSENIATLAAKIHAEIEHESRRLEAANESRTDEMDFSALRTLKDAVDQLKHGRLPSEAEISDLLRAALLFIPSEAFRTDILKLVETARRRRQELKLYVARPTVTFSLDVTRLCDYVTSSIDWLRDATAEINANKRFRPNLREFLTKIELLLSVVNRLVHTRSFGVEVFRLSHERHFENRFAISAHDVFDTRMNVAVYGEAGAGKSTTLHMYVNHKTRRMGRNDSLIFLPMNRVMSAKRSSGYSEEQDIERRAFVRALLKCILIYVRGGPSESSVEEFRGWIETRAHVTFVIDGFDEAVSNNRWLLAAVNGLPDEFANAQVIISSRDCIAEIANIQYLGITLLPFTRDQLKRFVEGWNSERGPALWQAIENQNLAEVAKNPLLATIVCSLHEHGISIPANEPEVYRKHIALLCGLYDAYKDVKRTTCPQEVLERVARAIAIGMHCRQVREIDWPGLIGILQSTFRNVLTDATLALAAEELISPCGVLKRIHKTDLVSFGHLRYQEFLASEELVKNHRHSPLDYLYDEWWKGVLYLYAV